MCACLWLGNMPDSGITITCDEFFGTRAELPFATLGISPLFPSFFRSFSDTHTYTRARAPGVGGERDKAAIIRLGPIRRDIL